MKVIDRNIMLKTELLQPHPDNPRKDVGDVTELADSIKVNGIFQNLTVIYHRTPPACSGKAGRAFGRPLHGGRDDQKRAGVNYAA